MSTHIMNKPQFLVGGAFGSGILLRSTSCIHAVVAATVHIAAKAPPTEIASATEARP
jgi:hypothetical protein